MASFGEIFHLGIGVLRTYVSDKTSAVLAQLGDVVSEVVEADNAELWQTFGLVSRPSKAEKGKRSAEAIVLRAFGHDIIIAGRDLRGLELSGNLGEGETVLYGAGEDGMAQGRVLVKKDGSITLLTTHDNTPEGKIVAMRVSPTEWKFTAPWESLTFDATGFHVKCKDGPRFDMGRISIPGLPGPIAGLMGGYCTITAPIFRAKAGSVYLGAGQVFNPAVWAPVDPMLPPPIPVLPGKSIQSQTVYTAL